MTMVKVIANGITWKVDPLDKFVGQFPQALIEACGIIPQFINKDAEDIVAEAVGAYGFGDYPMIGATIAEDGTHSYPEDPDMYPYMSCETGDYKIYIYAYGITAFCNTVTGVTVIHRFD